MKPCSNFGEIVDNLKRLKIGKRKVSIGQHLLITDLCKLAQQPCMKGHVYK